MPESARDPEALGRIGAKESVGPLVEALRVDARENAG